MQNSSTINHRLLGALRGADIFRTRVTLKDLSVDDLHGFVPSKIWSNEEQHAALNFQPRFDPENLEQRGDKHWSRLIRPGSGSLSPKTLGHRNLDQE